MVNLSESAIVGAGVWPGRATARITFTVLLTVAIMGTLCVPLYARSMPELGPFPFFYWYQLIWVPLSAVILWICYLLLRTKPTRYAGPRQSSRGARK